MIRPALSTLSRLGTRSHVLPLLLTFGLLLTACGGTEDAEDAATEPDPDSTEADTSDEASDEPAESQTIRQVQVLNSMTYLPVLAADELGYFEEENIELETVQVANPQAAISALLSGEGDYFMASPTAAAQAAGGGADIKTWASIYSEAVAEWVMQGDLAEELGLDEDSTLDERIEALPGLSIGLTAPNSPPDMLFRYVASQNGWNVDRDFTVQTLGGDGILSAFAQGRVDVMITGSPTPDVAVSEFDGYRLLSMQRGEYDDLQGLVSVVAMSQGAWLSENAEAVEGWRSAVERAMKELTEDPDLASDIAATAFESLDEEAREIAVESVLPGVPESTELTPDMLTRIFEVQETAFGDSPGISAEELLP